MTVTRMSGRFRSFVSRRYPLLLAASILAAKLPVVELPCSGDAPTYLLPTVYWLLDNGPNWFLEGGDVRGTSGFGHPPFVFHLLAGAMKVAGDSRVVARLVIAGFGALGVYCTARLGRVVFGTSAGWAAGTFLMLSPLYFTQAGLIRLSVPLTALGAATVLAALEGSLSTYLLASCSLVLTKEPGVCLMAAVLPVLWLRHRRLPVWSRVRRIAPYLVPVILFAVWVGLNQWKWGQMVNRPFIKWAPMHPWWRLKELLFSGGQWPLTLFLLAWLFREGWQQAAGGRLLAATIVALTVFLLLSVAPVGIRSDWAGKTLAALLAGSLLLQPLRKVGPGTGMMAAGVAVAVVPLFILDERWPRYLLPALPFFYVLAAGCLVRLLGRWTPLGWFACASALVLSWAGPRSPGGDMAYVELIMTVREATRYVEQEHGQQAIAISCFPERILTDPRMGYVTSALHAYDTDRIVRTVAPSEIGAYLFVLDPDAFDPVEVQRRRLREDLSALSAHLGRPLRLERDFRGRFNTAYVYQPSPGP